MGVSSRCVGVAQRVVSTILPAAGPVLDAAQRRAPRRPGRTSRRRAGAGPPSTSPSSRRAVSANSAGVDVEQLPPGAPDDRGVAPQEPVGRDGRDRAGGEADRDDPALRREAAHALLEGRAADRVDDDVHTTGRAHGVGPAVRAVHRGGARPRGPARGARRTPATATTSAPRAAATWTTALPRPPPAPCTSTRSPGRSRARRCSATSAVWWLTTDAAPSTALERGVQRREPVGRHPRRLGEPAAHHVADDRVAVGEPRPGAARPRRRPRPRARGRTAAPAGPGSGRAPAGCRRTRRRRRAPRPARRVSSGGGRHVDVVQAQRRRARSARAPAARACRPSSPGQRPSRSHATAPRQGPHGGSLAGLPVARRAVLMPRVERGQAPSGKALLSARRRSQGRAAGRRGGGDRRSGWTGPSCRPRPARPRRPARCPRRPGRRRRSPPSRARRPARGPGRGRRCRSRSRSR